MYRLKAVALITFLIVVLTGSVIFLSQDTSRLPVQNIESAHSRVHEVLKDKLLNAEDSLLEQSSDLASNPELVLELSSVREKLLRTTPEELKKQTSNKWNIPVFDQLIDWKQKRDSAIKQAESNIGSVMKAEVGSQRTQLIAMNWWKRSPDLLLAFANVPMKDGSTSSILIAHGEKGKELKGGKRYDETAEMLANVSKTQTQQLGIFKWDDRKIYIATATPVIQEGVHVGTVVVGIELSKKILDNIEKSFPEFVDLALVYASPKFGEPGASPVHLFYTDINDEVLKVLKSERFHASSEKDQGTLALSFDQVQSNLVYQSQNKNTPIAFSRVRWVWNPVTVGDKVSSEEVDIYVVTNLNRANASRDAFHIYVMIAGAVILLIGLVLIILLINQTQKSSHVIRKAIADAINSGEPIDSNAMALLIGNNTDGNMLPQYAIQEVVAEGEESDAEDDNWENMMMDFSDDANVKADAAMAPEELKKLKDAADADEAKPLYEEYMRKRRENGINAPMEFDVFLRRLQRNAAKIKETHHCENVTFQVQVNNGNVVLKPKLVK